MARRCLIIDWRDPVVTPGREYRASLFNFRLVKWGVRLVFKIIGDDGEAGLIRKDFTIRRGRYSANSDLAKLYAAATGRSLMALGEQLDLNRIVGAEFIGVVGWSSQQGKRFSRDFILRKKYRRDFLRLHEIRFACAAVRPEHMNEGPHEGIGLAVDPLVQSTKRFDKLRWEDAFFILEGKT